VVERKLKVSTSCLNTDVINGTGEERSKSMQTEGKFLTDQQDLMKDVKGQ